MEAVMHKELNVIKYYLTLLIFLMVSQLIYSQSTLNGKYSNLMPYQEHYNYFKFSNNGTFEYHSGASLGDDKFGKGHYQIKNDSLILIYDLTELNYESYYKLQKFYNSNDSDSIRLEVKVFNQKGIELPNVSVFNLKDRYGEATDKNGLALLAFKKQTGNKTIEVSDLCCGSHSFEIDTKLNYEIEVYLAEGLNKPKAIKDQIEKYEILKLNKNQLKLKKGEHTIILKKR